ncbi:hypothetical protein CONPUDRAFT_84505, partial [Coniophora puteana RWD-64-598 SS2]
MFSHSTASVSLSSLPSDLLIEIAVHLCPLDVLELRKTSKTLRDITYERDIWARIYAKSPLPHPGPPLPQPSWSREILESTIIRSAAIDHRMFPASGASPKSKRHKRAFRFNSSNESDFILVKGRWVISKQQQTLLCRDIDAADVQPFVVQRVPESYM